MFTASLRQAQELAEAASATGYAAKPLPLFYCLSQAGRAIAAAHRQTNWELSGHGIAFKQGVTKSVLDGSVAPKGAAPASFQAVSEAVSSPLLAGPASMAELIAANPDLIAVRMPVGVSAPRVLASRLNCAPPPFSPGDTVATGGTVTTHLDLPKNISTGGEVVAALASYPTMADVRPFTRDTATGDRFADDSDLVVRNAETGFLPVGKPATALIPTEEYWKIENSMFSSGNVDEHGTMWVFASPSLGGGPAPLPMMMWWALLLGLSSLARYHPAMWTAALDLDESVEAVFLEQVLDEAEASVPAWILSALS